MSTIDFFKAELIPTVYHPKVAVAPHPLELATVALSIALCFEFYLGHRC